MATWHLPLPYSSTMATWYLPARQARIACDAAAIGSLEAVLLRREQRRETDALLTPAGAEWQVGQQS